LGRIVAPLLPHDGVRPEDRMGYFDALTSSYFKTAADGRKLFFPWGVLGRGYLLDSDRDYERLRRQLKTYTVLTLVASIGSVALQIPIAAIVTPALLIAFYFVWVSYRLRGLQPSDERLSWRESMTSQALAHSAGVLWSLEIVSLAFVGIGAFTFVFDPGSWLIEIGSMLLFGLCAAVLAFMLAVRSNRLRGKI
jgi:hypothetical protein